MNWHRHSHYIPSRTQRYAQKMHKSLDELTFNCIFPTYEYAYVTVVRAETESNDLKNEPSVVTYDTVDCRTTKNIDSPKNKIIESNVVYENEDTFNLSSNNLTSTNVDRSIIKLTNQMKENFISAKQDLDNYLKTNLVGKTKVNVQDSITAKESQIDELLIESNDGITHTNHYDNDQNEALSHKDETLGSLKNDITSTDEEQDGNSLSSILLLGLFITNFIYEHTTV